MYSDFNVFLISDQRQFGLITPRNFLGNPIDYSTPSQPKIAKVSSSNFNHFDIWKAIESSLTIKVEKFDKLKDDARVWIERLEWGIISVGGVLDVHGMGVLSMFLNKDASRWLVQIF